MAKAKALTPPSPPLPPGLPPVLPQPPPLAQQPPALQPAPPILQQPPEAPADPLPTDQELSEATNADSPTQLEEELATVPPQTEGEGKGRKGPFLPSSNTTGDIAQFVAGLEQRPQLPQKAELPKKNKKGAPIRPPRHPEEDTPGGDYLGRLKALGPRPGETILSFEMRLASIAHGRRLLFYHLAQEGSVTGALAKLGIHIENGSWALRRIGLTWDEARTLTQYKPKGG